MFPGVTNWQSKARWMKCRKIFRRIIFGFFAMGALAMIGYGGYNLYRRDGLVCPMLSGLQGKSLASTPVKLYFSFCDPADPHEANYPALPLLNVSKWCDVMQCKMGPNQACLVYATGDSRGSC